MTTDQAATLTPKQARFVDELFIHDFNATAAYKAAGYKWRNEMVATNSASQLLAKPYVQAAVAAKRGRLAVKTEVTQERIVKELAKIAFSDMRHFAKVDEGVPFLPSTAWTGEDAAAVAEVSQTVTEAGGTIRLKLHDKLAALDKLAKHLGMYPKDGGDTYVDARSVHIVTGEALTALREARKLLEEPRDDGEL